MAGESKKLRAVILEDEKRHLDILQTLLGRFCPEVEILATADTIDSGRKVLLHHKPDLCFTDVELRDGDCFEILDSIAQLQTELIFITAHDHYAIKAIKCAALDYLLKPLVSGDLKDAVSKVGRSARARNGHNERLSVLREHFHTGEDSPAGRIALPVNEGYVFVNVGEIVRMEAQGNASTVYTNDGNSYTVNRRLQYYEDLLKDSDFLRVHHSHLINFNRVRKFFKGKGGQVLMSDSSRVDVSVRKKDVLLEKFRRG